MTPTLVLLAGLTVAQPDAGAVSGADIKRLAQRVLRLDPGSVPPVDAKDADAIKKLLESNPDFKRAVEKQVKDFEKLPPEKQREKLAELQKQASDPAVRKQIDQFFEKPPAGTPTPPATPPPGSQGPNRPAPNPNGDQPRVVPPGGTDPLPNPQPPTPEQPQPPTPAPSLPPATPGRAGYDKFVRFFEQNVGPLKDMPAVQQLAKELLRGSADAAAAGKSNGPLDDLLGSKTAGDLLKGLPEVGDRSGWKLPDFGGLPDPVSQPSLPKADLAPPSASVVGVVLGVVAAAVLLAVALCYLPKWVTADGPRPVPGLGPWPLDPRQVQTRADLVRAFEYLSVLLNGDPARAYSHEAAAAALREAVPGAADAAGPLAHAYALARYTPSDRPLSVGQIADARDHLCRLAGVSPV